MKNRLRAARAAYGRRGTTQLQTAKVTRIPKGRYWEIENGHTDPTREEQERLARYLRTTLEDLFPGQPPLPPVVAEAQV